MIWKYVNEKADKMLIESSLFRFKLSLRDIISAQFIDTVSDTAEIS